MAFGRLSFLRRRRPAQRIHEVSAPQESGAGSRELPAELLKRLEFKVLRRLDGFLFGNYTGLFYGPSLDLAEVREYQPGDEVRRIDWNVTARTGLLHVRQYREEREVIAWLVIDRSPSMDFGTRRALKRDVARDFAGVAAAIIARQGNKVGALAFSPGGIRITPTGSGRGQALAIVAGLLDHPPRTVVSSADTTRNGPPTLETALVHLDRTAKRRTLVFVVSDFLTAAGDPRGEPAWGPELRRLAFRHDVIAVRISDPAERELPRVGDLRLRDPESGREVWIDTSDPRVRRAHAQLVAEREAIVARSLRAARTDVLELSTDRDIVPPLLAFALRRRGRRA